MEQPKRKINRLIDYDYSTTNAYFITICTENRKNLLWQTVGAGIARPQDTVLSRYGDIVKYTIAEIPKHYPAISVDAYTIMPNHVHLLLQINSDEDGRALPAPTISTVVQQLKGNATKRIGRSVWQKGFYDHVIRSDADYLQTWRYIEENPLKWAEDNLYQA